MPHRLPIFLLVLALVACAYPRRDTHLSPAPQAMVDSSKPPADMWSLRIVSAQVPPAKNAGLPWDSDGTTADPFVRLYVDGRLIWESPTREDTLQPRWDTTLPANVLVDRSSSFRLELWDRDSTVSADPIGAIQREGLPTNALPDANARLSLDSGAAVEIVASSPKAHKGVGLRYEIHHDRLVVLHVEPYSPAARAGIKAGDEIRSVADEQVAHLSDAEAASLLSLASERGHKLVVRSAGQDRDVSLDKEPIWQTM